MFRSIRVKETKDLVEQLLKITDYRIKLFDRDEENGFVDFFPHIEKRTFLHPTVRLIGGVYISKMCMIGPYAVIRLDEESYPDCVFIGEHTNIQDHVLIHANHNYIGNRVNIAHHAIIHGSKVLDDSTIYIRSTLDHAKIGAGCFVDAHCYISNVEVPDNTYVPPGSIITSQDQIKELNEVDENKRKIHREVQSANERHLIRYGGVII
jgi:carbonic anhydrase/acetyltransferase-like protein (isoleucine patch superfamily)